MGDENVEVKKISDLRTGDIFLEDVNNELYKVIQYYLFQGEEMWAENVTTGHIRQYSKRDFGREVLVST